jgi:putative SOS response-associated peptidase YedK
MPVIWRGEDEASWADNTTDSPDWLQRLQSYADKDIEAYCVSNGVTNPLHSAPLLSSQ